MQLETLEERESRLLIRLATIMMVGSFSSFIVMLTLLLITNWSILITVIAGLCLTGFCAATFAYFSAKKKQNIKLGSWLIVGNTNLVITFASFVLGIGQPVLGAYFISTMLCLFLLPWQSTIAFLFFAALTTVVLNLGHYQSSIILDKSYETLLATTIWLLVIIVPACIGIYLLLEYKKAYTVAFDQNQSLLKALKDLEVNRIVGHTVSKKLNLVTSRLQSTASQQAVGSQQQAKEISQISTGFKAQVEAASFVAITAEKMGYTFDAVLSATSNVTVATQAVAQQGERGWTANTQTIQSITEIRDHYQGLLFTLENVQDINSNVSEINSIIQKLTRDLHVLSINAAIEAGGASERQVRMAKLAQEIKRLAERSGASARTINSSLDQVRMFLDQAAQEIRTGQRKIQMTAAVAHESGKAIEQLVSAIEKSQKEAANIAQLAFEMHDLTALIKEHTARSYIAIQNATENLQNVSIIAQQNAGGSSQISHTASGLAELSDQLTTVLVSG